MIFGSTLALVKDISGNKKYSDIFWILFWNNDNNDDNEKNTCFCSDDDDDKIITMILVMISIILGVHENVSSLNLKQYISLTFSEYKSKFRNSMINNINSGEYHDNQFPTSNQYNNTSMAHLNWNYLKLPLWES